MSAAADMPKGAFPQILDHLAVAVIVFDSEIAWKVEERTFHPHEHKQRRDDGKLVGRGVLLDQCTPIARAPRQRALPVPRYGRGRAF